MVSYPEDWEVKKLGDIADVTKLAGFEFTAHVKYSNVGKIIAIRGLNVKNGALILDDIKYIDNSNFSKLERSKLYQNDIIFTYVGTVGEVAIIPENDKYYLAPNVARIRLKGGYYPKFIVQYIMNKRFYNEIITPLITTTSQPALSMQNVREFVIKLPPLAEQKAIAETLETFDAHIKNISELIEKKKAIRDGALEDLMSGRIRLKNFSGDWEIKKLGEIVDIIRGASPRPIEAFLTFIPNGVNWIKISDTDKNEKYITKTEEKITHEGAWRSVFVNEGDLILSNSMSFGRPYILKISGCIHDGWLKLYNYKSYINKEFLCYSLSSKNTYKQYLTFAAGSGVKNLNKNVVRNVLISIPSLAEQKAIAETLTAFDDEIKALEAERDKIIKIRDGAMNDLLTGKIRLKF